jgi:20S proteasome subunit beta 7
MYQNPQNWGRPQDNPFAPQPAFHHALPTQHTQSPSVTGTSVLGIKFNGGVVIAADNLASYGSLARFSDVKRLRRFNDKTVLGFGGDVSDMQYLDRLLTFESIDQNYASDDPSAGEQDRAGRDALAANNVHTFLTKVMYRRRNSFDPLWNHILVAGLDDAGAPFLADVDLLGTQVTAPSLSTGFGAHLAQPIMRKLVPDEASVEKVTRDEAVTVVRECLKVLYYRDARSMDRYSLAVITKDGVELHEDEKLENQSWQFAESIRGYGTQVN